MERAGVPSCLEAWWGAYFGLYGPGGVRQPTAPLNNDGGIAPLPAPAPHTSR